MSLEGTPYPGFQNLFSAGWEKSWGRSSPDTFPREPGGQRRPVLEELGILRQSFNPSLSPWNVPCVSDFSIAGQLYPLAIGILARPIFDGFPKVRNWIETLKSGCYGQAASRLRHGTHPCKLWSPLSADGDSFGLPHKATQDWAHSHSQSTPIPEGWERSTSSWTCCRQRLSYHQWMLQLVWRIISSVLHR